MKPVAKLEFDYMALHDLEYALKQYWLAKSCNGSILSREELYSAYLVKKFYDKLLKRQASMIESGRSKVNISFDSVHAILLVQVLRTVYATPNINNILSALGSKCPPQFLKS